MDDGRPGIQTVGRRAGTAKRSPNDLAETECLEEGVAAHRQSSAVLSAHRHHWSSVFLHKINYLRAEGIGQSFQSCKSLHWPPRIFSDEGNCSTANKYGIPKGATILGPFDGRLDNHADQVALPGQVRRNNRRIPTPVSFLTCPGRCTKCLPKRCSPMPWRSLV